MEAAGGALRLVVRGEMEGRGGIGGGKERKMEDGRGEGDGGMET